MDMWSEFFVKPDVDDLKDLAFEIHRKYRQAKFLRRWILKGELKEVLDEIDYQEGRLQYANRPYSFQSLLAKHRCLKVPGCRCVGCWPALRSNFFRV